MKTVKDGWHEICGRSVYVENGCIDHGMKNNDTVSAYPYRASKDGWSRIESITVAAFAAGVRRGTIELF